MWQRQYKIAGVAGGRGNIRLRMWQGRMSRGQHKIEDVAGSNVEGAR
jgi:hypothetical protein